MVNYTRRPLLERFEDKYVPDLNSGCWLWIAKSMYNGYGMIARGGAHGGFEMAHRASYILFKGPIPDGVLVLHKCDTPCCVNPDHLFLGSSVDNSQDMFAKRRQRKSKHGLLLGVCRLPDYIKCVNRFYGRVRIKGYGRTTKYFKTQEEAHEAFLVLRQQAIDDRFAAEGV